MKKLLLIFSICLFTGSCGIYKYSDARKNPVNADERVKKNIEEGKGFRLGSIGKSGGDFLFSSSNPMWRASIKLLEFTPLSNVDYSGGIIITDWFYDGEEDNSVKITVKFLSNEIRPDGIDISLHQKDCSKNNVCKISKIQSALSDDLAIEILKRAALYKKDDAKKIAEELGEYRVTPAFNTGKKRKK